MPEDTEERRILTDADRIRQLAETRGARPAYVQRADGDVDLRLPQEPDDVDADRITWDEFFERYDPAEEVVQYRVGATGNALEVVDRHRHPDARPADSGATRDPADVETEPLATGDTGDAEPVAFERTENEQVDPEDTDHASTASTADSERAPFAAAEGLVLDRIHEAQAGLGSEGSDEFLEFENTGDAPIDLSEWTVENGAGRSYQFPSGTVLGPGESIRLHSEDGEDTEDHLHWGADEPVWGDKDVTVVVRTETGERVLRERYET